MIKKLYRVLHKLVLTYTINQHLQVEKLLLELELGDTRLAAEHRHLLHQTLIELEDSNK